FIRGYGVLFFLLALPGMLLLPSLLSFLEIAENSQSGIVWETLYFVVVGLILCAVGWKVNHPSRIPGDGIGTKRWFPFTWSGHMCFFVKLEYLGLLLILARSILGGVRLLG